MEADYIRKILEDVKAGHRTVDDAIADLKYLPFEDLGFAKVDHHRQLRNGYPEVIFCQGKRLDQIQAIIERMAARGQVNILATRAGIDVYEAVKDVVPDAEYHELARIVTVRRVHVPR